MKEALFYEKKDKSMVRCRLCAHECWINPGKRGICRVRENGAGTLYTLSYGKLLTAAIDPIEKKPLYHFLPGSTIYSICTAGCNFSCLFCQNADISQITKDEHMHSFPGANVSPEQIVRSAFKNHCQSIAYTYTEPTIYYEYAYETARLAHQAGLKNVFITNGYIRPKPLKQIAPYLDAVNVDLKGFSEDFYKQNCMARLQPVLDTIKLLHELQIWTELTTLLILDKNDSQTELEALTGWIADLDSEIPWHVSAFHPAFKMQDVPPTSAKSIYKALDIGAKAGLKYTYVGNINGEKGHDTLCPQCGEIAIKRNDFAIENFTKKGLCKKCQTQIKGVF